MGAKSGTVRGGFGRVWASVTLAVVGVGLMGCQADFGADVHNKTPQPLFAQLYIKGNSPGSAALARNVRLGPGDRAYVGPVRTNNDPGRVFLSLDTLPNPGRPLTYDLAPGTAFLEVTQEGEGTAGRLMIREKP